MTSILFGCLCERHIVKPTALITRPLGKLQSGESFLKLFKMLYKNSNASIWSANGKSREFSIQRDPSKAAKHLPIYLATNINTSGIKEISLPVKKMLISQIAKTINTVNINKFEKT